MRTGLVLEGGGLRGMFTNGVIDTLMHHDIKFDGMIGVSAGALFGCNYKSQQPGRALRYNLQLRKDPRYMGLRSLLRTGDIVGADFCYHVMPFKIDVFDGKTFEENPMEFWMVVTDIESGTPVYHKMEHFTHEELEWMRASASMPVVSRPVKIDGHTYLDGGIIDSIPLKAFQQRGYDRNVVVLTQPRECYKKPLHAMAWLIKLFTRKYPKVAEMMKHRHEMYNNQLHYIAEQERRGDALLLYPSHPLHIGRTELNKQKMLSAYQHGADIAESNLLKIKEYLNC